MEENVICSTEGLADYELCVSYDITGGMVTGAAVNQMDTSIVFGIDATDDGTVTFYMTPSDISGANLVLVDGEEWDDVEIDGSTVTVSFPAGAEEIEGVWSICDSGVWHDGDDHTGNCDNGNHCRNGKI